MNAAPDSRVARFVVQVAGGVHLVRHLENVFRYLHRDAL